MEKGGNKIWKWIPGDPSAWTSTVEKLLARVQVKSDHGIGILRQNTRHNTNLKTFKIVYHLFFVSYLRYGAQLWGQANKESQNKMQVIQNWALRKISFKKLHDPTVQLYKDLKGNMQFVFSCNPQKSGTSEVCIIFTQTTQKIPTKDRIY